MRYKHGSASKDCKPNSSSLDSHSKSPTTSAAVGSFDMAATIEVCYEQGGTESGDPAYVALQSRTPYDGVGITPGLWLVIAARLGFRHLFEMGNLHFLSHASESLLSE